jgi:tricorn protease
MNTLRNTILSIAAALSVSAPDALAAELGYYAQPAVHGDQLLFVSEGDLWTARIPDPPDSAPIIAHRLTISDGEESFPVISPDGSQVAFAAQYDGNTDVYIMPITGGPPTRLTYHGAEDIPLDWTPDAAAILFRSNRSHPMGRTELHRVSVRGGMPTRYGFGECSRLSLSSTGRRFVFTRWSNEHWHWKGYRGGTAPEIWVGELGAQTFLQLTDHPASDILPMWIAGRVFFLSDRTGTFNLHSMAPQGGDLKQHTTFAPDDDAPQAVETFDARWASCEKRRGGTRIVFCQAGELALYDVRADTLARLDVRIASDRVAARRRWADAAETMSDVTLTRDGAHVLVAARGELLALDVLSGDARQLTYSSGSRERGVAAVNDDTIALITDLNGEQQVATMPLAGGTEPSLVTESREAWLFPLVASPDGQWVACADKTMRLHAINLMTLQRSLVDRAEGGEITDYRFSPNSLWLAYTRKRVNGTTEIVLHSLSTLRSFTVSHPLHSDREPRWDPAGKYLYFISDRHMNPVQSRFELEHAYTDTSVIVAVPLAAHTPPPLADAARAAGFDLGNWANPDADDTSTDEIAALAEQLNAQNEDAEVVIAAPEEMMMQVDTRDIVDRQYVLPIEPGRYSALEAAWGSILFLAHPLDGMRDEAWPPPVIGTTPGDLTLVNLVEGEEKVIREDILWHRLSGAKNIIAVPMGPTKIAVTPLAKPGEQKVFDLENVRVRIDAREEWRQIFTEAWRLQRDFYWAPNMAGVDWNAMRSKYEPLVNRVGTREELNDVIGEMSGELGTSHTYIGGGDPHDHDVAEDVNVGLLGADIEYDGAFRIAHVCRGGLNEPDERGPLSPAHLNVEPGTAISAINGRTLEPGMNIYALLADQAGKAVTLTLGDGADSRNVTITALPSERRVRYLDWVEANRRFVEEASDGAIGYIHIPDMGGDGLAMFSRQFYGQYDKRALIIDVRDNGGGYVSSMILNRLAKSILANFEPRHGAAERYPERAVHAHLATIIDQHAGSDGDIFPSVFQAQGMGPLIGTRTWGGVVGIRADKPFVDRGMSTQAEYAWWDANGWSIENFGVAPDIEVDNTPADHMAGRDAQLERAIEYLKDKLEEDEKYAPIAPEYPERQPRDVD